LNDYATVLLLKIEGSFIKMCNKSI